jgi:hypothetical protein
VARPAARSSRAAQPQRRAARLAGWRPRPLALSSHRLRHRRAPLPFRRPAFRPTIVKDVSATFLITDTTRSVSRSGPVTLSFFRNRELPLCGRRSYFHRLILAWRVFAIPSRSLLARSQGCEVVLAQAPSARKRGTLPCACVTWVSCSYLPWWYCPRAAAVAGTVAAAGRFFAVVNAVPRCVANPRVAHL